MASFSSTLLFLLLAFNLNALSQSLFVRVPREAVIPADKPTNEETRAKNDETVQTSEQAPCSSKTPKGCYGSLNWWTPGAHSGILDDPNKVFESVNSMNQEQIVIPPKANTNLHSTPLLLAQLEPLPYPLPDSPPVSTVKSPAQAPPLVALSNVTSNSDSSTPAEPPPPNLTIVEAPILKLNKEVVLYENSEASNNKQNSNLTQNLPKEVSPPKLLPPSPPFGGSLKVEKKETNVSRPDLPSANANGTRLPVINDSAPVQTEEHILPPTIKKQAESEVSVTRGGDDIPVDKKNVTFIPTHKDIVELLLIASLPSNASQPYGSKPSLSSLESELPDSEPEDSPDSSSDSRAQVKVDLVQNR